MRYTLPIQEQQLFELFSNFNYKLPKDPELILYDFYFLTAFEKDITGRNMNANYAVQEASDLVVEMLHRHMRDAVFYAVCAEIRHLFDSYRLDGVYNRISKEQFTFLQEFYKEYSMLNGIKRNASLLGIQDIISASERDRKILSKEEAGGRMSSYKAVKSVIKKLHWNRTKFAIFAEDLFNTDGWSSSYGGKPWAKIALAFYRLERASKKSEKIIWIDHAYDLQHNTDTVFNKLKLYYKDGGYRWIKSALDWKRDVMELKGFYNKVSTQLKPMVAYVTKVTTGKSIISAEDEEENHAIAKAKVDIQSVPVDYGAPLQRRSGQKYKFKEWDAVKISDMFYHISPDDEVKEWANLQGINLGLDNPDPSDDFKIYAIGEHPKYPNEVITLIQPNGQSIVYMFYVDGIKKKPMVKLGTQMHDPDQKDLKFKIGDMVEVIDNDYTYTGAIDWAKENGFKIMVGAFPAEGTFHKVIAAKISTIGLHQYGIENLTNEVKYIVGEWGIALISSKGDRDKPKFKTGDTVVISNSDEVYPNASGWASDQGFTITVGKTPDPEHNFEVIAAQALDTEILYGIRSLKTLKCFVVTQDALSLPKKETSSIELFPDPKNKDQVYENGDKVKVINLDQVTPYKEAWMPNHFAISTPGKAPTLNEIYTVSSEHSSFQTQQLNIYMSGNGTGSGHYVIHSYGVNLYSHFTPISEPVFPETTNEPIEEPSMVNENEYIDISSYAVNWTNVKLKSSDYDYVANNVNKFSWLKESMINNAHLKLSEENYIIFESGVWEDGWWKEGIFKAGIWENGHWTTGTFDGGVWKFGKWEGGWWKSGTWESGEILQDHGHYEYSSEAPEL